MNFGLSVLCVELTEKCISVTVANLSFLLPEKNKKSQHLLSNKSNYEKQKQKICKKKKLNNIK